jgi:hypothetical protein
MIRCLICFQWELRRLLRSRAALTLLLAIPIATSAYASRKGSPTLTGELLIISIASGWILLYLRTLADKATGFADGLESTPAGGTAVYASKMLVGVVITVVQVAIYAAVAHMLGTGG